MERIFYTGLISLLLVVPALAGEVLWSSITDYTSTKANKTVPISQVEPIKVITAAMGCEAYVDDTTGDGAAIPANTFRWFNCYSN